MADEYGTYKIEDAVGVLAHRVVVRGAAAGGCKKPSAEGEGKVVGVTLEAQATQNKPVAVKKHGLTHVVAAGVIAYGDYIYVGDNTGKVKSCQSKVEAGLINPAAVVYVIGTAEEAADADNDIILADIFPVPVALAVS